MPGESTIEWTDATWNPVTGCTQVSRGCDHCYALTFAERWRGIPGHPYEQGFDLKLWPQRLDVPLRWQRPRKIFVNSMSDLFHADVPTEFIAQVFAVMSLADHHVFQVLTKRPQRMMRLLNRDEFRMMVMDRRRERAINLRRNDEPWPEWPLRSVWLGTSVEDQEAAFRIDFLAKTPAAVRFLSCEPLLGPINLRDLRINAFTRLDPLTGRLTSMGGHDAGKAGRVDWVIAGGESGPGFRPVDPDWIRSLRDQCVDAGVPFFFKQWGGIRSKAGGRELDGRTWDEMPEIATHALTARVTPT